MKNLFSGNKLISVTIILLGLGVTSSSYALAIQDIYDIPEPGTMALTAMGLVGMLVSRIQKK